MTCIVGVVDGSEVWVGADGRASFGYYQSPVLQPKMVRVGQMLIGASGMPRVLQLLQCSSDLPSLEDYSPYEYLCGPFARWLRETLKDQESMGTEEGDACTKTHLLIALRGHLFLMDGRFAVYESERGFHACGSGLEVALGYLIATPGMDARSRVEGALMASSDVIPAVGPPFHVEKL